MALIDFEGFDDLDDEYQQALKEAIYEAAKLVGEALASVLNSMYPGLDLTAEQAFYVVYGRQGYCPVLYIVYTNGDHQDGEMMNKEVVKRYSQAFRQQVVRSTKPAPASTVCGRSTALAGIRQSNDGSRGTVVPVIGRNWWSFNV